MSVHTEDVVITTEDADVTGVPDTPSTTDVEQRFMDLLQGSNQIQTEFNSKFNWPNVVLALAFRLWRDYCADWNSLY